MSGAGVRSSGSTCGKRPGEADDRTVQSTKETSASTDKLGDRDANLPVGHSRQGQEK